jgi:hypothetical protein
MEKLGADDLMPAFMYSLVKANVPYLYSELQFLNDFVVERNYSADEFNHYLMTRKRMSDLEAALHFINSIDMNVRDEKNALVPVTTMVDRVIDILHVGVAEFMQRKVVGSCRCCCRCIVLPHTLFIPSSGSFAFSLMRPHRFLTHFGSPSFFSESATGAPNWPGNRFPFDMVTIAACQCCL